MFPGKGLRCLELHVQDMKYLTLRRFFFNSIKSEVFTQLYLECKVFEVYEGLCLMIMKLMYLHICV